MQRTLYSDLSCHINSKKKENRLLKRSRTCTASFQNVSEGEKLKLKIYNNCETKTSQNA